MAFFRRMIPFSTHTKPLAIKYNKLTRKLHINYITLTSKLTPDQIINLITKLNKEKNDDVLNRVDIDTLIYLLD